jgi:hypothetical protein
MDELEDFFDKTEIEGPVRLDQCSVVIDIKKFTTSHINILRANSGKMLYLPYYHRLLTLYHKLNE